MGTVRRQACEPHLLTPSDGGTRGDNSQGRQQPLTPTHPELQPTSLHPLGVGPGQAGQEAHNGGAGSKLRRGRRGGGNAAGAGSHQVRGHTPSRAPRGFNDSLNELQTCLKLFMPLLCPRSHREGSKSKELLHKRARVSRAPSYACLASRFATAAPTMVDAPKSNSGSVREAQGAGVWVWVWVRVRVCACGR